MHSPGALPGSREAERVDNSSPRGDIRRDAILDAARTVFMEQGYSRFTMRKVATATGISLGNLNYHFPRKDDLLNALLERIFEAYIAEFDRRRHAAGESPENQLIAVLEYWIDDLLSRDTTIFFPELWALSNHDPHVAAMTDRLYQGARAPLLALLPQINPALSESEVERLALLMCASMEGLTVFAGHEKPWSGELDILKRDLVASFMHMIRSTTATP
jgi:AcrR family transcriptional regulator